MSSIRTTLRQCMAVVGLLCCLPVQAVTVYRTVDANGVISYSDVPPEDDPLVETLVIHTRESALTESEGERLQAMRETTDRMAADRREREKHRAELRQQRVSLQPQPQPQYQDTGYTDFVGYGSGYYYPVRRPGGRLRGPRLRNPIARPPLQSPGHGQLPHVRPPRVVSDYPASLVRRHYSPQMRALFER